MKMVVLIPLLLTVLASMMPVKQVNAEDSIPHGTAYNWFLGPFRAGQQAVAFSAALNHHVYLQANEKVKYDTIFTNVGGGYNSQTGIFTCPTAGIYTFQLHALSRKDKSMWLELHHNHGYVASIWGHIEDGYSTAGNSVILRLAEHDEVFVVAHKPTHLYNQINQVYGTFSGYLLRVVERNGASDSPRYFFFFLTFPIFSTILPLFHL